MNTIKLSDIIISESFKMTTPSESKMNSVRAYVKQNGKLDKPIVLDGRMLTDNYVRYLVAKEFDFKKVPYISVEEYRAREVKPDAPITCIVGKFNDCDKEYTWRLTKDIHVEVGDRVLVKCKHKDGKSDVGAVTVVKVFTTDSDNVLRHKPVIKKLKRGNKAKSESNLN